MITRILVLILLLLLTCLNARSQENRNYRVSILHSHNTEKLAKALTKNISSDSEKVFAIHYWITHHIKYDTKKWLGFDYSTVPTKKILRRRKATCVGYSDLFNELCQYSGIKSVGISGYAKDMDIDLGDKFYESEHEWNAVYINNRWLLVDACWDAGYIKTTRSTLGRRILHFITFGRVIPYAYHPHFIFNPTNLYFLKSGNYFLSNHLPLNPLWQLRAQPLSIQDFEQDSAAYFSRFDESKPAISSIVSIGLDEYFSLDEEDKLIKDGLEGNKFNPKNNYPAALSWFMLSKLESENLDIHATDMLKELRICDSILFKATKSKRHLNLSDSLLPVEKESLLNKNAVKRQIFNSGYRTIFSSCNNTFRVYRNYKRVYKQSGLFAKRAEKNCNKKLANPDISFYKIKYSKTRNNTDSLVLPNEIKKLSDSCEKLSKQLTNYYSYLDSTGNHLISRLQDNILLRPKINTYITHWDYIRKQFYDDLDYPIIKARDSLTFNLLKSDSAIFIRDTALNRYYYLKCRVAYDQINHLYALYREKINQLKKLKHVLLDDKELAVQYEETKNNISSMLHNYQNQLGSQSPINKNLEKLSGTLDKIVEAEKEALQYERKIEQINNAGRLGYISKKFNAFRKINRQLNSRLDKIQRPALKYKSKFASLKKIK